MPNRTIPDTRQQMPAVKARALQRGTSPVPRSLPAHFLRVPSGLFIEHVQCEGDVEDDFFEQKHFTIGEEFFFPE